MALDEKAAVAGTSFAVAFGNGAVAPFAAVVEPACPGAFAVPIVAAASFAAPPFLMVVACLSCSCRAPLDP
ncbi:hypothetical protein FB192DRAFT_1405673 [Mucor lusitanicus]|uniref:Uncharacterized protein n=1 Tax=Mucor circinelloides f. lusitanicus TaxID=29924 RepID=A0A8H4EWC9_MUCCL|nr:hypothetical protein FB192DRAFT_1405673 [Mucor lusitanicus]